MLGHQGDQLIRGFVTSEFQLAKSAIAPPKNILWLDAKQSQDMTNLGLVERVSFVLPVDELDIMLSEQGDRPTAGASRPGAD